MKRRARLLGLLTVAAALLAGWLASLPDDGLIRQWIARGGQPVVVIDPGHGGRDPGAVAGDLLEKDLTLDLARRLERILRHRGVRTAMTRGDDSYLTLTERTARAAAHRDPILVSLHFNKERTGTARGIETFFFDAAYPDRFPPIIEAADLPARQATESELLAATVQVELIRATGARDRGIKNQSFFVVREATFPSILVEGGFLSHPLESRLAANGGYREILARAIAEGIVEFLERRKGHPPAGRIAQKSPTGNP